MGVGGAGDKERTAAARRKHVAIRPFPRLVPVRPPTPDPQTNQSDAFHPWGCGMCFWASQVTLSVALPVPWNPMCAGVVRTKSESLSSGCQGGRNSCGPQTPFSFANDWDAPSRKKFGRGPHHLRLKSWVGGHSRVRHVQLSALCLRSNVFFLPSHGAPEHSHPKYFFLSLKDDQKPNSKFVPKSFH